MKTSERGYINFGRGFGHTQAMLNGAKNTDNVVIVAHTQRWADELAKQCKNARGVGLDNTERLLGLQLPILMDHYAIEILLGERDRYIAKLEARIVAEVKDGQAERSLCLQLEADNRLLMHVVHGRAMASSLPKHLKDE